MPQHQGIEKEIQEKASNGPRITLLDIEENIDTHYFITGDQVFPHASVVDKLRLKLLTLCVVVTKNGFTVIGQSGVASPENYNKQLGEKIARNDAISKLYPLMGYALKQKLFEEFQQHV